MAERLQRFMTYGLVFDGGGARGAFHIGVWRALKELKIDICAVCGTSIGAINAALFIGAEYDSAYKIWTDITLSDVVTLPDKIKVSEDLFDIKNIFALAREIKESKGLDMEPLRQMLIQNIDEHKIRASSIDFGLVTYSLTQKKENIVFLKDIPQGYLVEYLLASATFPLFKPKQIKKAQFIDGGVVNNMPINVLINQGIKDIIAVDVKGVGFYKDFNTSGKNIINIASKKPTLGTMEFDAELIKKSIEEGYFQTMHAFGVYCGEKYFINEKSYRSAQKTYSPEIISGIESAAQMLGINPLMEWGFKELCDEVIQVYLRQTLTNELVAMLNENKFDPKSILSLAREEQRLCLFVKLLQKEGFEYLKSKAPKAMGEIYRAASAVLYFL